MKIDKQLEQVLKKEADKRTYKIDISRIEIVNERLEKLGIDTKPTYSLPNRHEIDRIFYKKMKMAKKRSREISDKIRGIKHNINQ